MQPGTHVVFKPRPKFAAAYAKMRRNGYAVIAPVEGKVYTIRASYTHRIKNGREILYVRLAEITQPLLRAGPRAGLEIGIRHDNFHPLTRLRVEDFTLTEAPVDALIPA